MALGLHAKNTLREVCGNLNPVKTELLRQVRKLEAAGLTRHAEQLDLKIASLEHWQNRVLGKL